MEIKIILKSPTDKAKAIIMLSIIYSYMITFKISNVVLMGLTLT